MPTSKNIMRYPYQIRELLSRAVKADQHVRCASRGEAHKIRLQLYGLQNAMAESNIEGNREEAMRSFGLEFIVWQARDGGWTLTLRQREVSPSLDKHLAETPVPVTEEEQQESDTRLEEALQTITGELQKHGGVFSEESLRDLLTGPGSFLRSMEVYTFEEAIMAGIMRGQLTRDGTNIKVEKANV